MVLYIDSHQSSQLTATGDEAVLANPHRWLHHFYIGGATKLRLYYFYYYYYYNYLAAVLTGRKRNENVNKT